MVTTSIDVRSPAGDMADVVRLTDKETVDVLTSVMDHEDGEGGREFNTLDELWEAAKTVCNEVGRVQSRHLRVML